MIKKVLLIFFLIFLFSGCSKSFNKQDVKSDLSTNSDYAGSYYKGNYVWGGAMVLAWNDLSKNILKDEIKLNTNNKDALQTIKELNESPFSIDDLDENSYYIKSGYGQMTVDLINREIGEKFPQKSFENIKTTLREKDIIAYAYLFKAVEYFIEFQKKKVFFNGEKVNGFSADSDDQKENINVVKFLNADKFILSIKLKDNKDKLFVAKGFSMDNPQEIIEEINSLASESIDVNRFEMPNLHLDFKRDYDELINIFFANEKFREYFIKEMFESIKFDMDHKGAEVEMEARMDSLLWGGADPAYDFILDKPFWVVLKREKSNTPYFILGVNNTELMEK